MKKRIKTDRKATYLNDLLLIILASNVLLPEIDQHHIILTLRIKFLRKASKKEKLYFATEFTKRKALEENFSKFRTCNDVYDY